MGLVVLASGGVDSSVISLLAASQGVNTYPLFVDYGQLCAEREWSACVEIHKANGLPEPQRMSLPGFGQVVPSGLTSSSLDIVRDAFLPCRNLLFAVCGAAYAHSRGASCVALGLIDETEAIFPDQTGQFIEVAERAASVATGNLIRIIAPLHTLTKAEVLAVASQLGLKGTYSCHKGTAQPCGQCISCLERIHATQSE
jgi:7-cyano-7-deazaguanine synthase